MDTNAEINALLFSIEQNVARVRAILASRAPLPPPSVLSSGVTYTPAFPTPPGTPMPGGGISGTAQPCNLFSAPTQPAFEYRAPAQMGGVVYCPPTGRGFEYTVTPPVDATNVAVVWPSGRETECAAVLALLKKTYARTQFQVVSPEDPRRYARSICAVPTELARQATESEVVEFVRRRTALDYHVATISVFHGVRENATRVTTSPYLAELKRLAPNFEGEAFVGVDVAKNDAWIFVAKDTLDKLIAQ